MMLKIHSWNAATTLFVPLALALISSLQSAQSFHAAPSSLTRRHFERKQNNGGASKSATSTRLNVKKKNTAATSSKQVQQQSGVTSRQNRVAALEEWAKEVAQIQVSPLLKLQQTADAGLGWFAAKKQALDANALVLTVPSGVALTVECPGGGPDDAAVAALLVGGTKLSDFPWFVQMALYLYKLDRVSDAKQGAGNKSNISSYRPWLDTLPRQFTTPLHWSSDDAVLKELLQYDYLVDSVQRQRQTWKQYYDQLLARMVNTDGGKQPMSWDDFVWGCECARSRAFSGTFTGDAFNPSVYAFTLLLVTIYVGAGLGTLEQAANGAGLVLCFSILKGAYVFCLFAVVRGAAVCACVLMHALDDSLIK